MTLFLLDAALKSTAVLGAAALMTMMLRRASAASRHLVWTVALIAALVLPVLSFALPRWQAPIVTIHAPLAGDAASQAMTARMLERFRLKAEAGKADATTSEAVKPESRATSFSWLQLALGGWIVGATIVLARLLLGFAAVQWLSKRTERADDAPWLTLALRLASDLGISKIAFRRSERAAMPLAWGIIQPTVMMPAAADSWTQDRLRIVLLHELAHVKRRDCLTHMLAQVTCAVYWFNPLAWMAARRVRAERERACDDLVLAAGTRGADYADQLLEIARAMSAGRYSSVMATASLAMAHRSQLEGRLMAILDPSVPRTGISRARLFGAACVAAVTLVPLASVQAWTVSQVAPPPPPPASAAAPTPAPAAPPPPDPGPRRGVRGEIAGGVRPNVRTAVVPEIADAVEGAVRGRVDDDDEQDAKGSKADPKVIAALTAALKDSDKDVRETAMHALVQLRDPNIFEPLLVALKDGSPDMRQQAAFGLSQLRDKRAVEPLLGAIKDTSDDVREQVAFALGQLRDPRATEGLISMLKDTHANVREQAAFALGQLRAAAAVEALVVALKDQSPNVREQVAFALGQIRDPRAIDGLTTAMKDSSASVRQQAAFALGQIAR
jgi:beta-lactamase regulating signal transducer with metallopeptidase domain